MKEYGLKFDDPNPEHYVFGASPLPMTVIEPDGDWTEYLPAKEIQNLNGVEPYACVSYAVLNAIETLIKKQYGEERNYSDRFLASISGTKEGGNSPQVVCDYLREVGVVGQESWPFDEKITTFDKYYERIPQDLIELAKEFREEWDFGHEFVPPTHEAITAALKCSPLMITFAAWYKIGDLYYRPQGMRDNHAIMMFNEREGQFRRVFDTYDHPNIKDLEWKDLPMIVKRFYIRKKITSVKKANPTNILDLIIRFIKKMFT